MIGQHVSTATHLEAMHGSARLSVQTGRHSLLTRLTSIGVRSITVNALLSSLYAFFLYANVKFFLQTGSLVSAGLVIFNTIAMTCVLVRRSASRVTGSIPKRVIACVTFLLPYGMRPVASTPWVLVVPSILGQVAGLVLMIASLVALNRSIGILAANRGVKTGGPYAWIRHPMYAGEILFLFSFLLSNWMFLNAVVVCAILAGQLARLLHEEALLLRDERYALYQTAVPHRLVPWVF